MIVLKLIPIIKITDLNLITNISIRLQFNYNGLRELACE